MYRKGNVCGSTWITFSVQIMSWILLMDVKARSEACTVVACEICEVSDING